MSPKGSSTSHSGDSASEPGHGVLKLASPASHHSADDNDDGDSHSSPAAAADDDSDRSDQSDQLAQASAAAAQRPARAVDSSVKPIKSRPMDSISGRPKKLASSARPSASQPRSKRTKVAASVTASPKGGRSSKRIWGKEDELVLLHGLLDYQAKKGHLPTVSKEMEALHRHVEGSLRIKVSNMQLSDKVRGLKRKFNREVLRGKKETDFSDDHEKTLFILCNSIWGSNKALMELPNPLISDDDSDKETNNNFSPLHKFNNNNSNNNNTATTTNTENGHAEGEHGNKSEEMNFPYLTEMVENIAKEEFNGPFLKRALLSLDGSKAMAIEKKIKKFRTDEIELGLRRIDLLKESVKLLLDSVKKSE